MRINTQYEFVFISIPKACTQTMYQVLDRYYSKGLIKEGFHNVEIPIEYRNFFRWTICRNPYSRAVSLWRSVCRPNSENIYSFRKGCEVPDNFTSFVIWLSDMTLEKRIYEHLMINQSDWLRTVEPVKAIHMENLKEELSHLDFWKLNIDIPKLNTSRQKIKYHSKNDEEIIYNHWIDLYKDDRSIEAVIQWAGSDFERFEYSKEIGDHR